MMCIFAPLIKRCSRSNFLSFFVFLRTVDSLPPKFSIRCKKIRLWILRLSDFSESTPNRTPSKNIIPLSGLKQNKSGHMPQAPFGLGSLLEGCTHTCARAHTHTHTGTHIPTHIHTLTFSLTYMHTHKAHINTHTRIRTRVHTYARTYTHSLSH